MENLPQKRLQVFKVFIFSLVRNVVPTFSGKKEQKKKELFFNVACPVKENNLTRRPNGKYKNLMEIISNLNGLIVAYNKLK